MTSPPQTGAAGLLSAVLLLASCSSEEPCRPAPGCSDIVFQGRAYDEWRTYRAPRILQEIGDATYPACNADCSSSGGLGGFATTDVWQLGKVPPEQAVLGLREGTHTYVVFVAVGTDPDTVLPLLDSRRLG